MKRQSSISPIWTVTLPLVVRTQVLPTMFKMRELLLRKKQKELSEYKAMYIIKGYFLLFYQALHKNIQELSKVLLRLFNLLQHNGRKSHRYEKKQSLIFWVLFMSIPLLLIR